MKREPTAPFEPGFDQTRQDTERRSERPTVDELFKRAKSKGDEHRGYWMSVKNDRCFPYDSAVGPFEDAIRQLRNLAAGRELGNEWGSDNLRAIKEKYYPNYGKNDFLMLALLLEEERRAMDEEFKEDAAQPGFRITTG